MRLILSVFVNGTAFQRIKESEMERIIRPETTRRGDLSVAQADPEAEHGGGEGEMDDQDRLLPGRPVVSFLLGIEGIESHADTEGCCSLQVVLVEEGLIEPEQERPCV